MKQSFQMHLYAKEEISFDAAYNEVRTGKYVLHAFDGMDFCGFYVGQVTVEAEVPDSFDFHKAQIQQTEYELHKVRAEYGKRVTELQRRLAELQAIEYAG